MSGIWVVLAYGAALALAVFLLYWFKPLTWYWHVLSAAACARARADATPPRVAGTGLRPAARRRIHPAVRLGPGRRPGVSNASRRSTPDRQCRCYNGGSCAAAPHCAMPWNTRWRWRWCRSLRWAPRPAAERLARCYARAARPRHSAPAPGGAAQPRPGACPNSTRRRARPHRRRRLPLHRAPAGGLRALSRIGRESVKQWIRYEGFEHFEQALARGKGVLFATAHLGNWELSAFAHALLTAPMHVVVRPLDNPLIDRLVERRRALSGNRADREEGLRARHPRGAAPQRGGRHPHRPERRARHTASSSISSACRPARGTGFARLAAHSGAAVIPGFALWSDDERRYVLRFYPPVAMTGDAAARHRGAAQSAGRT